MTEDKPRLPDKRSAVIRRTALAVTLGAPALAISVYGVVELTRLLPRLLSSSEETRVVRPEPEPQPQRPPEVQPATPTKDAAGDPTEPSGIGPDLAAEIEATARLGDAETLFARAEARQRVLCRLAGYCEALDAYEKVRERLEKIGACITDCDQMRFRTQERLTYIETQLPVQAAAIKDALACAAEQELCACVAAAAERECR